MPGQTPEASAPARGAADDAGNRAVLELRVGEMRQLFNAMDPAPFRERDLDPKAVEYILEWGRETRKGQPLGLIVHLGRESPTLDDEIVLRDAIHEYFRQRAKATRRALRQLFRVGRISLVIGVCVLAAAIGIGEAVAGLVRKDSYGGLVKETLVIGGWVALWRPAEIFLYEWWPIRAAARLEDRLAEMNVRVVGAEGPAP
jgi:hypothetical protein